MSEEDLLVPGASIRPILNTDDCRRLLRQLYGLKCAEIKELNGYDDKNYLVKCVDGGKYVLKIMNSLDSKKVEFVEAQNRLLLHLREHGVNCPEPVKTLKQEHYSVEELKSGRHVVRVMVYLEGRILAGVVTNERLFREVGKYVATLDEKMESFHNPIFDKHSTLWSMDSVPQLRNFLYVITEPAKRQIVEEVVADFEKRVLNCKGVLSEGLIHGDFNEQNVLVDDTCRVCGVLDFGDVHKSRYLYELAIVVTYMLIVSEKLDVGGQVVAGYFEVRRLSDLEYSLLKVCIMARLCQSLVLGAYSSQQDPGNDYLLTTSVPGWKLLQKLKEVDEDELLTKWKTTLDARP